MPEGIWTKQRETAENRDPGTIPGWSSNPWGPPETESEGKTSSELQWWLFTYLLRWLFYGYNYSSFVAAEGIWTEDYCPAGNSAGTGNRAWRCPGCFQGARAAAGNPKAQGDGASVHCAQVGVRNQLHLGTAGIAAQERRCTALAVCGLGCKQGNTDIWYEINCTPPIVSLLKVRETP